MIWLATLGYIGRLPAGGTWGSALALLLYIPVAVYGNWQAQLLAAVVVSIIGIPICARAADRLHQKDPSMVVWDELAGMWIALIAIPLSPWYWLLAFVLFRLFDITKPLLVGWCDANLKGGVGIMADDLVAGLMTLAMVHLMAAVLPLP